MYDWKNSFPCCLLIATINHVLFNTFNFTNAMSFTKSDLQCFIFCEMLIFILNFMCKMHESDIFMEFHIHE